MTIFTANSLWYLYFAIELVWFMMINLVSRDNVMAYFAFVVLNSLIGILLLLCLSLSSVSCFLLVLTLKFAAFPALSVVFNYVSVVRVLFLLNYLFLKLSYFLIYLTVSSGLNVIVLHPATHALLLLSLVSLFLLSLALNVVSFNLYSLVSSSFNYFIVLLLVSCSSAYMFSLLYVLFYTFVSALLYLVLQLAICTPSTASFSYFSPSTASILPHHFQPSKTHTYLLYFPSVPTYQPLSAYFIVLLLLVTSASHAMFSLLYILFYTFTSLLLYHILSLSMTSNSYS